MVCIGLHASVLECFTDGVDSYMWEIFAAKFCGILSLAGRQKIKCLADIPVIQFARTTTVRPLLIKILLLAITFVDFRHGRGINILFFSNLLVGLTKGLSGHYSHFFGS